MQTVYSQISGGVREYWTYCDGDRVTISKHTADKLVAEGERFVVLKH